MKIIGITKEIDRLGRLGIPKEIRTQLGLNKKVELIITPEGLLIKNPEHVFVKINDVKEIVKTDE